MSTGKEMMTPAAGAVLRGDPYAAGKAEAALEQLRHERQHDEVAAAAAARACVQLHADAHALG
jgi:hypothetical protein